MLEQLQANVGKKITLELINGRVISGTLLNLDQMNIRLETEEGVGTISLNAVQIVWESVTHSLTEEKREQLFRDNFKAEAICHGTEYSCRHSYYCSRHHYCTRRFNCRYEFSAAHKGGNHPPQIYCHGNNYSILY